MTDITHTPVACGLVRIESALTPARAGATTTTTTTTHRRSVPERLRTVALAIRRLLPARSSTTPSQQALDSLSPSDRLGERH